MANTILHENEYLNELPHIDVIFILNSVIQKRIMLI